MELVSTEKMCGHESRDGEPLIAILMAVYEPDLGWLGEQLRSLNAQSYPNLCLYIRDDCSPTVPFERICQIAGQCVDAFPWRACRNEKNVGSTKTFALLAGEASGEYFAFCDQDDVWLPDKLQKCYEAASAGSATMAYCGQSVIDGRGRKIAADVREVRKRDEFFSGSDLARKLFVRNCVYGCTTLFPAGTIREALPVPEGVTYDHWFSLWAAARGTVVRVEEPLIAYRLHGENQSYAFHGICSKHDYYLSRIRVLQRRARSCVGRFPDEPELRDYIRGAGEWADARERWYRGELRALPQVWKGRKYSIKAALFELLLPFVPEALFRALLRVLQS